MADSHRIIGYEIRAMKKACEEMPPYQRQDCPVCAWPLETSADNIIHCRFCGWTDQNPILRQVERP
jgi:ribosomal protein L37AE/L43A